MIALSYSRISDYRQCPHKFNLKYLDKAPNFQLKDEDKSPALVRGGNIHKSLDRYIRNKLDKQPNDITSPEVARTAPLIDGIMDNYNVSPEKQIAIDSNFKEVSWYSKDAYFRVIMDLIGWGSDLLIGDFKTGKLTDYTGSMAKLGQLHMSAIVGFALWPEYEFCSSIYIYVDHQKVIPTRFKNSDFEPMKEQLIIEHETINSDVYFKATKNQFCRYCEATSAQCNYSTK